MMSGACDRGSADMPTVAPLTVLDVTGSTNDDVRDLAQSGAEAGTAIAAHRQTAGRGRRGHIWSSPRGNLYLSVLLRPDVPMPYMVGLAPVCALGVLDALRDDVGLVAAALKWPNDIVFDGGKLGGILVEAGTSPQGFYAVCGIGINIAPAIPGEEMFSDRPDALPRVCLDDAPIGDAIGFDRLAALIRDRLTERVDAWSAAVCAGRAQEGPLAPVLEEYFGALAYLGQSVAVYTSDDVYLGEGSFTGVDAWGHACIRLSDGQDVDYAAEQVTLRPLQA